MRRQWQSFLGLSPEGVGSHWEPAADIYRGSRKWLVKLELAGVRPEEVEVLKRGRTLVVRGARRDVRMLEEQQFYSMEISYNRFERTIELPVDLDKSQIRTEYRDGMFFLEILLGTGE